VLAFDQMKQHYHCRVCGASGANRRKLCRKCQPSWSSEMAHRYTQRFAGHAHRRWALRVSGNRCSYCRTAIDIDTCNIDHIKPRLLGGKTCRGNLTAVCRACNKSKCNRYQEWFEYLYQRLEPAVPLRVARWRASTNFNRAGRCAIIWLRLFDHFPTVEDNADIVSPQHAGAGSWDRDGSG